MLTQVQGLHHVTSLAANAQSNNSFFVDTLGLRRIKKTVNFDNPKVYHLYYGDGQGAPGTVMTYFPFPNSLRGTHGVGEVGCTAFSIPKGTVSSWEARFEQLGVNIVGRDLYFGQKRLSFVGPDGDELALIETANDTRAPWQSDGIPLEAAVRGFHSVSMRLADDGASADLLKFMGYEEVDKQGDTTRFAIANGNGADTIDIEKIPSAEAANQGAGSVHHIAFAVENRARQLEVREALLDTGYQVTQVFDRNYFWAIYFKTPGGVLFEVATNEPGFDSDEDIAHLGQALKLPAKYEHMRAKLQRELEPLPG